MTPPFRTAPGHKADALSDRAMNQSDAWVHDPPPRQCGRPILLKRRRANAC
jgi:hypothetical protein